jgi:hypothetical protein
MGHILLSNTLPPSIITTNVSGIKYETQYEMPDEVMRWQPPICLICKERKYCYVSLPYGSEYDGEIICGDCCHKHFDPVIREAVNAPGSQD